MTQEQNLLSGSVPRKLIAFALPLLLANILQSFYNVVDILVVGQFVGETGLAAISNASKLCYIINSICIGMTMGGAVLIAQYKGANNKKGQAETFQMLSMLSLATSILLTVISLAGYQPLFRALNVPADAFQDACNYMKIICYGTVFVFGYNAVLLTVISLAGYQPLFRALNVPADAFQDACNYMKIICYGTVFVFGYNAVCSVLKGLGDSKSPLCFVGIATIINVGLDIILVGPLGMGTKGAAYATIIAQGISFVIAIFYLKWHHVFFGTTVCKKFTVQWDKIVAILKIGLPTAIQMVVVNTAYLLVTGMLNQFGTSVSAASGVGLQINTFAGMPCWAVGQAVTAMVGQCMGAEQIKRARKVVKIGLLVNIAMTLVVVLCVQVFAEQLILLFGSNSQEVVTDGVYYLRVCCGVNSLIYAAMYTLDSFAIGVGAANVAMLNALLDAVVVRLPVSWILAFTLGMGFPGIYFGQALSPILPAFVGFIYFKSGIWERKSLIQKNRKEGNPE